MKKTIYHGSNLIIEKPELKKGRKSNDFGRGFYCTEDLELAKEWACQRNENGYANEYELELQGLRVLDLLDGNYSVLNWIALLLENRKFRTDVPIPELTKQYLIKNFSVNTTGYDVIIGYRADDSYFAYASQWISNELPIQDLQKALFLGNLGEQLVLKSEKACAQLTFRNSHTAIREEYYPKYIARDEKARTDFRKLTGKKGLRNSDIFAMDIIRGEMRSDDARLQQYICKRRNK